MGSEVNTLGLVCNVDIFPVPTAARDPSTSAQGQHQSYASHQQLPEPSRPPFYHPLPNLTSIQLPPLTLPTRPAIPQTAQQAPTPSQRILTYFWDQPITEDMNCTTALSGATFIQLATIEYQGHKALVFPFAVSRPFPSVPYSMSLTTVPKDLAVKIEGQFFLRYRCFDIFSRTSGHGDLPIQAECFGGPFRIYSTKEFPGLQPSTELTKVMPMVDVIYTFVHAAFESNSPDGAYDSTRAKPSANANARMTSVLRVPSRGPPRLGQARRATATTVDFPAALSGSRAGW